MSQVRTIVCFRRRSSTILFGFAFDFLQFASVKSLKIFIICEIFPPDHLKAEKIGVTEEVSSLFVIFCLLPLSQIWPYEFFYQQALGRAQICLTVQQILGNSTEGNAINLARKIPIFKFVAKH